MLQILKIGQNSQEFKLFTVPLRLRFVHFRFIPSTIYFSSEISSFLCWVAPADSPPPQQNNNNNKIMIGSFKISFSSHLWHWLTPSLLGKQSLLLHSELYLRSTLFIVHFFTLSVLNFAFSLLIVNSLIV